jgi:myo-inositol-1(or 4)-monophosphatase
VDAVMALESELKRIEEGLRAAGEILAELRARDLKIERKERNDPVTEADLRVDAALRELLPRDGEGWLSEETADDASRLSCERVWVVDPIDGTREYVADIPEWCVSIGLVEEGRPLAGGIYNPATDQLILGGVGRGVTLNGQPATVSEATQLDDALVLASRSEVKRGEWERFEGGPFRVQATGSVAFKLAQVAAGLCDATWTLVPKSEWDVAAGVALVQAAGGEAYLPDWELPTFNRRPPKLPGLIAAGPGLLGPIRELLTA